MPNVRVYELAKRLGIKSKTLMEELEKQGVVVKSHMSTLDSEMASLILDVFGEVAVGETVAKAQENGEETVTAVIEKPSVEERSIAVEELPPSPPPPTRPVEPAPKKVVIEEATTVKELAEKLEKRVPDIIKALMEKGIVASMNQVIDSEVAVAIAKKFGLEATTAALEKEEAVTEETEEGEFLVPRAPVVTVMGHVDHGKTSLLDAIRVSNVIETEAGGITQHIGAYEVETSRGRVVFLDTPGHEAFTAMRARGAQITDVVVLVVAADDGVMPQTREAIAHAKAAGVPIVVAVNKIDLPNANPERVKQELSELGLIPEEWGGETIYAEISAKRKIGIDHLLEMILLQAEILELKANPNRPAKGVVIEAKLDKTRGPVATVLVQKGTLRVGDPLVAGLQAGKVRALINDKGKKVTAAGPSTPVEVLGLSGVPEAGDTFVVVSDERRARQISAHRSEKQREEFLRKSARVSLEDLYSQIQEGAVKELNIVIKADVQGSVQALREALEKLSTSEVKLVIIQGGVGGITEGDVMLASASNALIIGFNVRPTPKVMELAEREGVEIRLYTIIYEVISDMKAALEGLLEPETREKVLGRAEVRETFIVSRVGTIAGCYVTNGVIPRNAEARLIRDNIIVYQGKIASLRRFKEDVSEVQAGYECGIALEKFNDIKEGDIIEPFLVEKVARKL